MNTTTAQEWNEHYAQGQTPWDSGQVSLELQRLHGEFDLNPRDGLRRCLEIGCGTGVNAVHLAELGFQVTANDLAERAIERAKQRAAEAGVKVDLHLLDLTAPEAADTLTGNAGPFPLVFDRGVYHCVRREHLSEFLRTLAAVVAPGGTYINLAGNANDPGDPEQGPPRVSAEEMLAELGPLFELVQLREIRFDGVIVEGEPVQPLGWSAVWRRVAQA